MRGCSNFAALRRAYALLVSVLSQVAESFSLSFRGGMTSTSGAEEPASKVLDAAKDVPAAVALKLQDDSSPEAMTAGEFVALSARERRIPDLPKPQRCDVEHIVVFLRGFYEPGSSVSCPFPTTDGPYFLQIRSAACPLRLRSRKTLTSLSLLSRGRLRCASYGLQETDMGFTSLTFKDFWGGR